MQYRHEYKFSITLGDYRILKSRLSAVMRKDPHVSEKGYYQIRSLYFDTDQDKALLEKVSGITDREKFRIRCYDLDYDFIRLEKKVKKAGLGYKLSTPLTRDETARILLGETDWMAGRSDPLLTELYSRMKNESLRPKTVIDYTREPFVYPAGNVRVTLDSDIRTGLFNKDLLSKDLVTIPSSPGTVILEVKYDRFLPDFIRDAVQLQFREQQAFSKYEAGRRFG